jgi:hypothetical protein
MNDSGTGGRSGAFSGTFEEEYEIREFSSRPRVAAKSSPNKIAENADTKAPVISRTFGKRMKTGKS